MNISQGFLNLFEFKAQMLDAIWERLVYYDNNMRISWANKEAIKAIGSELDEITGRLCHEVWQSGKKCEVCPARMALNTGKPQKMEIVNPEGEVLLVQSYPVCDQNGGVNGVVEIALNITDRKNVEEDLRKSKEQLETMVQERTENLRIIQQQLTDIIDFLPDATFVIDRNHKVIAWNKATEKMTGVPKEEILGKGNEAYSKAFYGFRRPMLIDLLFADREPEISYEYFKQDGHTLFSEAFITLSPGRKPLYLWATATPLFDNQGILTGAIETVRDISDRKDMETQLKYLATHDYLTKIPNRLFLEERLKRAVNLAKLGIKSALLFIDLDNFKLVNDILGHSAGDDLLITLVNIFKNSLQESDLLARFGGDEFALLVEDIDVTEARVLGEKLRKAVDENEFCLTLGKTCFNLSISVGIVMIDGNQDAQKILALADTALYSAKEKGRNRVVVLESGEEISNELSETNKLVGLIKRAIKENRFLLHFQPVVRMNDGKIMHYETLIRLQEEDGSILMPGTFIPAAERFGLMPEIDRWVVQMSMKTLHEHKDINLFINLSGSSLGDDDLLNFIEGQIAENCPDPTRVAFEITETSAVKDITRAEKWIRRIKEMGCHFALDDFGIGFSSFTYLRLLPVDYLKIDGSFVRNIDTDSTNKALIQAMNTVAHTLGKKTVAEFVENEIIYKELQEVGVDFAQGYYLGKPSPISNT